MKADAILGVIRHLITTMGGILVANGTINAGELETGAGAVAILLGIGWSIIQKRKG